MRFALCRAWLLSDLHHDVARPAFPDPVGIGDLGEMKCLQIGLHDALPEPGCGEDADVRSKLGKRSGCSEAPDASCAESVVGFASAWVPNLHVRALRFALGDVRWAQYPSAVSSLAIGELGVGREHRALEPSRDRFARYGLDLDQDRVRRDGDCG